MVDVVINVSYKLKYLELFYVTKAVKTNGINVWSLINQLYKLNQENRKDENISPYQLLKSTTFSLRKSFMFSKGILNLIKNIHSYIESQTKKKKKGGAV